MKLDYQFNQANDNQTIYCLFTLLDRTPFVQVDAQIGLNDARTKLENAINTQIFQFYTDYGLLIETVSDSLKLVQVTAMISGIFVGILSGLLLVFMVMSTMKRKVNQASANNFAFENISFHVRTSGEEEEERATIAMEHPVHVSPNSPN